MRERVFTSHFAQSRRRRCKFKMDHSRFVGVLFLRKTPDGELLADLSSDDMKALMQSRSGSHLLEVIVRVAPRTLGAEIWRRFFRDKLMSISKHPVANFVLQSVLGSSKDPAVVASAVSELSALFGTLLYENRAGVIAALLAACLRLKTNEKDCCKALARGVTFKLEKKNANNATTADGTHNEEGGGGSRKGGKSQLARALLFLGNPPHGRCSVLGAAMMQTLAKYPADATVMFLESLCDTDPKTLLQAARDASGSHAIEAILNSRLVKAKHKKAIAELLVDNAVALAVSSGGSRVLEACYRETDNKTKKKIVELCSKREKEIVATRHGVVLFKRLGVKQFQNNASGWEKREEKSAAIRAEFEKEFGIDAPEKEKEENRNKTVLREVPPPPQKRRATRFIREEKTNEKTTTTKSTTKRLKRKARKRRKRRKRRRRGRRRRREEEEIIGSERSEISHFKFARLFKKIKFSAKTSQIWHPATCQHAFCFITMTTLFFSRRRRSSSSSSSISALLSFSPPLLLLFALRVRERRRRQKETRGDTVGEN